MAVWNVCGYTTITFKVHMVFLAELIVFDAIGYYTLSGYSNTRVSILQQIMILTLQIVPQTCHYVYVFVYPIWCIIIGRTHGNS